MDSHSFLFLANHTALDFLNTRPVQNDVPSELLPDFASVLRWFSAAGLLSPAQLRTLQAKWSHSRAARSTFSELLALREGLRHQVLEWIAGKPLRPALLERLNQLMAAHPMLSHPQRKSDEIILTRLFDPHHPDDLFAPLAFSAASLFAVADRSRIRQCASCVLLFLDTSKKGMRQWCSMNTCGNRAKVAAYSARQRAHRS